MEGVGGIVHSDQTDSAHPEYQRGRKLMTAEVNAAVEGALKGGATEVLVNDSHGGMRNLLIEELNPEAILLSGATKQFSMMAGIDRTFDAVFFTGYHARAGSSFANLDHTWNGPTIVQGIWLNGVEVGEYGLNAALAGYFGVPVVLMTGDQTACAQAKELLGADLETVVVKEATGRASAKNLHPTKVHALIRDAAARAVAKETCAVHLQIADHAAPRACAFVAGGTLSDDAERQTRLAARRRVYARGLRGVVQRVSRAAGAGGRAGVSRQVFR